MATMKRMTLSEFQAEGKAQGISAPEHIAFKCVRCGTIQSLADFDDAGIDREVAERQVGFSCIGRHVKDKGCDWTLGGLLALHVVTVVMPDGGESPAFELVTPEEAVAHESDRIEALDETLS